MAQWRTRRGVLDVVNKTNPLPELGEIDACNPCGEQFLHHYDVCNLGSINLAAFVKNGTVDYDRLRFVTRTATRLLDNVVDSTNFP
jgi:ribonucleoside-diphosphate reductase alpha chain